MDKDRVEEADREFLHLPHTVAAEWTGLGAEVMADANIDLIRQEVHDRLDRWFPTGRKIRVSRSRVLDVAAYYTANYHSKAVWSLADLNAMVAKTIAIHIFNDLQDDYEAKRSGVSIMQDGPRWDANIQRYEPTHDIQRVSDPGSYTLQMRRPVISVLRY